MDASNAPNAANPNAQDQFMDAVQGPANQAQGPAVQNQAQGPAVQNQAQGHAVQNQAQGPANSNAQVGQNVPCSLNNNCPQYNQSPLNQWCLPLRYFIKIG